jgi:hypothetical protein
MRSGIEMHKRLRRRRPEQMLERAKAFGPGQRALLVQPRPRIFGV